MLTEQELREIIAKGESFEIEFKSEEREAFGDRDLIQWVVCLANGRGGYLLIGIEDDGRVTGARHRHGSHTDTRRTEALIANSTVPPCPAECSLLHIDNREILVIEVPSNLPITSTADGVFRRRGMGGDGKPACLPFHFHEMQIRESDHGNLDPSARILSDAQWNDLDPLEFERVRQTIRRNSGRADAALLTLSDHDLIKALGLGDGREFVESLTVGALLLFGREEALRRFLPTHEVTFQVFSGTRILVNEFFIAPLVRVSEELLSRFLKRNEEQEIPVGMVSVGIPDYSLLGFREATHNALVHRDYARLGSVHVQWHKDRIDVSNPGGFVEGVTPGNLLTVPPKPRNRLLADAFKRIGLAERSGRGVDTIYEGQLRYGRPAPDYSASTRDTVCVILHGGQANLSLARWIIEHDTSEYPITVEEMLIVNTVDRERRLDAVKAASLIQRSESTARAILERLVERGILEARRQGRSSIYGFSPETYRALGTAVAHSRIAGFDSIRQEHMVLQYVEKHGRITRSQVADLCGLGSEQARELLRRLVRTGQLSIHGRKRSAFYTLPDSSKINDKP